MKKSDVAARVKELERDREETLAELERLREALRSKVDADIGEGDPKWVERDMLMSMIRFHERHLDGIEQVLAEARHGQYGICERCGQPIDPERLEALPETTYCIKCKLIVEKWGMRKVEV